MNTQELNERVMDLPAGFTARGAKEDDIEPAVRLFNRWSRSVIGRDEAGSPEIIRTEKKG